MKDLDARIRERIAWRAHNRAVFVAGPAAQVATAFAGDVVSASDLRQRVMRMHEPYMEFEYAHNQAVCQVCTCHGMGCGADYVYWPCETYKLARDWSDDV